MKCLKTNSPLGYILWGQIRTKALICDNNCLQLYSDAQLCIFSISPIRCFSLSFYRAKVVVGLDVMCASYSSFKAKCLGISLCRNWLSLKAKPAPWVAANHIIHGNAPDSKVHGANMGPSGAVGTQVGPMLAPWTSLSGARFASFR